MSEETLVRCRCGKCDVVFGMTETMHAARKKDGETFFCPNGHPRVYRDSEMDQLRRERDRLQQQMAQKDDELSEAQRSLAAQKGQVTRLKNRAKAGLCPCCNRHFTNLERHMTSKHAEEAATTLQ